MPAAKSHVTPDLHRFTAEVTGLVPGLLPQDPVTLVDDEASGISAVADTEIRDAVRNAPDRPVILLGEVSGISAYSQVDRNGLLIGFTRWLFPSSRSATDPSTGLKTEASSSDVLRRWFLEELQVPIDGTAVPWGGPILDGSLSSFDSAMDELAWLHGLSPEERRRWFSRHRQGIANGTLTFEDFG